MKRVTNIKKPRAVSRGFPVFTGQTVASEFDADNYISSGSL